jgi:predicted transcriptional regulator
MGLTRTDLHNETDIELASIARAMAHPARIAILRCLFKSEKCITGSLTEQIGLAQATISQHLKELKSVGIIQGTITGTAVMYCINPKRWDAIAQTFAGLFDEYPNPSCC